MKREEAVCQELLSETNLKRATSNHVRKEWNACEPECSKDGPEQADGAVTRAPKPNERRQIGITRKYQSRLFSSS